MAASPKSWSSAWRGNLIGSDYVEQAFTFDKERGGTDPVWRYNSVGEKRRAES